MNKHKKPSYNEKENNVISILFVTAIFQDKLLCVYIKSSTAII